MGIALQERPQLWTPYSTDPDPAHPDFEPIPFWDRSELKALDVATRRRNPYAYHILRQHGGKLAGNKWVFPQGYAPPVQGGSFLTGTNVEVLFSSITTGTQLNTFTTEDNLMKTIPPIIIPAGFFYNLSAAGKCLRFKCDGRLGTTATPTFTFNFRLLTSTTWSAAGVGVATAAITAGSGVTLAPWFMDLDIVCRALVAGATGLTLAMMGELRGGTALAATGGGYSIPAANTAFTVTLDNSVTQYAYVSVACGASSNLNLCQTEMIKMYGEN